MDGLGKRVCILHLRKYSDLGVGEDYGRGCDKLLVLAMLLRFATPRPC